MIGDRVEGVQQLTVVEEGKTSFEEMRGLIAKTHEEHSDLLQQYHRLWYNSSFTWSYTHFLGVGVMKSPNDLWMYQALMTELRPTSVIETGTYQGGSALWFAFLMDMLRIDGGVVYTIDVEDFRRSPVVLHPRIKYIHANAVDRAVRDDIAAQMEKEPGTRLVCLDSDHSASHVYQELKLYAPLVRPGEVLVVEDTNISWTGDRGDRGASGGLQDYVDEHPGELMQDVLCERYLLTMNPGGWLRRVAPCPHER
jgi:cephalosporin hydroxylase